LTGEFANKKAYQRAARDLHILRCGTNARLASFSGVKQVSVRTDSSDYQRGLELAEAGKHQEALVCLQEHLREAPNDPEVLNDTGAILHCLGRCDDAIDHFLTARSLHVDSHEIVWNLVEAYLAANRPTEATELLDDMERMGILNIDVLNRTADVFLNQDNRADALKILNRSLELCPEQEILKPMIKAIRLEMAKDGCE